MVEHAGLQVIVLQSYGGYPAVIADILAKQTLRVPAVGALLAKTIQVIGQFANNRWTAKNRRSGKPNNFPSMYFLIAEKARL
jgi:hypothetical protein